MLVPPGELPPPRAQYYSLMARRVPRFVTSGAASRALQQDQAPGSPRVLLAEGSAPLLSNGLAACTVVDGTAFLVFQTNRAASDFLESHRAQFGQPGVVAWLCRCQCVRPSTSSGRLAWANMSLRSDLDLNVLTDTYGYSCFLARLAEHWP